MGIVNFPGDLSIAVVLQFKGETVASALATTAAEKGYRYLIANESVTEFELRAYLGGAVHKIGRKAAPGKRLWDEALNTYLTGPVSGADLDTLLAGTPKWAIDLTFKYSTFFDVLLESMTADDAAMNNTANPADSDKFLATFTRAVNKGAVSITYKAAIEKITNVKATLVDKQVAPGTGGKPPSVKLVFELDFTTGIDAKKRSMMRKLLAMDWSKLAKLGKHDNPPSYVLVWEKNVYHHLLNNTSLARGRKIRDKIKDDHKAKTAEQLSKDLRNDIDGWIVTANHWGEARESLTTEKHQRLLSDLFGTLHQQAWLASPVQFSRTVESMKSLSPADGVALTFTWGAGHCGEHAACSFHILKTIIDETSAKEVSHVVFTGNANIDHAFVVYNLNVKKVVKTKTTAANNSRMDGAGKTIHVWNLKDAISENAPKLGFVMDPYLDATVQKPKAEDLLAALNNAKRKAAKKHTDYLAFDGEHPSSYSVDDITGSDEATRKTRVPNV